MAGTTAEDRAAFSSESDGDSTAKRASVWGHLQDRLTISGSGLEVQQIPRVNDCLGTDGQTVTFNFADFKRYPEINTLDPNSLLG